MSDFQSIFKRYEKKYLLGERQYDSLMKRLSGRLVPDVFEKSGVCNIYFDTPDKRLVRASLERPVYKEKLRLRSYGTPGGGDTVFVELKKKYKGVVYKRRADMTLAQAENYLGRGAPAVRPSQITRELDWFMKYYGELRPAMYISYDRLALLGAEDPDLRVTFDSGILYRENALDLGRGLLLPGERLMEIKTPGAMPLWFSHILNDLKIYPASFSKYGNAYLDSMAGGKKGGRICA